MALCHSCRYWPTQAVSSYFILPMTTILLVSTGGVAVLVVAVVVFDELTSRVAVRVDDEVVHGVVSVVLREVVVVERTS